MPHVLIGGKCTARSFWEGFEPRTRRDGDRIVKSINAFLAADGGSVLVECAAVEAYLRQTFLVQLIDREDGVLVRLLPASTPEKSPGVRFCLAWVALQVRERNPGSTWGPDTLGIALPD